MHTHSTTDSRATTSAIDHYDGDYFSWQNRDADLGAELNRAKFSPFLGPDHRSILDFGCGGGWLLKTLEADAKIGI